MFNYISCYIYYHSLFVPINHLNAAATEYRICIDGDVRLSRGGYEREGLVEVCVNNRWGTICGDSNSEWDKNEAAVVCSQLGFDLAETSKSS